MRNLGTVKKTVDLKNKRIVFEVVDEVSIYKDLERIVPKTPINARAERRRPPKRMKRVQ